MTLISPDATHPGWETWEKECCWPLLRSHTATADGAKRAWSNLTHISLVPKSDMQLFQRFQRLIFESSILEAVVPPPKKNNLWTHILGSSRGGAVGRSSFLAPHRGPCEVTLRSSEVSATRHVMRYPLKWKQGEQGGNVPDSGHGARSDRSWRHRKLFNENTSAKTVSWAYVRSATQ